MEKSSDLTALNLFPHLENADSDYIIEMGELQNGKGLSELGGSQCCVGTYGWSDQRVLLLLITIG